MHHSSCPSWLHPIALIVDPDGSESSNTMEVIAEDPLLQEVSDLAMGWLVKLRQVHRISESALGDVTHVYVTTHPLSNMPAESLDHYW